jgi:hypothetical protein
MRRHSHLESSEPHDLRRFLPDPGVRTRPLWCGLLRPPSEKLVHVAVLDNCSSRGCFFRRGTRRPLSTATTEAMRMTKPDVAIGAMPPTATLIAGEHDPVSVHGHLPLAAAWRSALILANHPTVEQTVMTRDRRDEEALPTHYSLLTLIEPAGVFGRRRAASSSAARLAARSVIVELCWRGQDDSDRRRGSARASGTAALIAGLAVVPDDVGSSGPPWRLRAA